MSYESTWQAGRGYPRVPSNTLEYPIAPESTRARVVREHPASRPGVIRFAQQAQRTFDALLTYSAVTVALATATLQRADNMQRANLRDATRANVEPCDARLPLCALHLRRPVDPTCDMQPTHATDTLQRAACNMVQHATDNVQRWTTCTNQACKRALSLGMRCLTWTPSCRLKKSLRCALMSLTIA